ncbi:hypothetical protein FJTKL_02652 [Diaporthe vaccinii]|uniref:Uncharacterized protein n=1 Tax=Diaporthe vaccinii TaxID=105482 RepID=A0ABR4DXM6_9PEZI
MAPHQECECGILNAGILTEEHGWSDNLSRQKELHTRGQLRPQRRGQARSSSSTFAAPERVLSNATWGRLELPCKRCRWRTKRRVNGCPDRGVHDPGPRSSAFCLPASLFLQEPVKASGARSSLLHSSAGGQLVDRNATDRGAKTVAG